MRKILSRELAHGLMCCAVFRLFYLIGVEKRESPMTFKHEKRIPPVVWTVVADRARARFFSAAWPSMEDWQEFLSVDYEPGAMHGRDITTDAPGTFGERAGGHHSGDDETDLRHQSAEHVAATIIDKLETARAKTEFGQLAIVAPPLLLGVLRKKLPSPLQKMLVLESNKDYASATSDEIAKHLQPAFAEKVGQ